MSTVAAHPYSFCIVTSLKVKTGMHRPCTPWSNYGSPNGQPSLTPSRREEAIFELLEPAGYHEHFPRRYRIKALLVGAWSNQLAYL